jgi:hypothetical protein
MPQPRGPCQAVWPAHGALGRQLRLVRSLLYLAPSPTEDHPSHLCWWVVKTAYYRWLELTRRQSAIHNMNPSVLAIHAVVDNPLTKLELARRMLAECRPSQHDP